MKHNVRDVKGKFTKMPLDKFLKVALSNGIELSGPQEEVIKSAKLLGFDESVLFPEKEYYNSSKMGYLKYESMQTNHLMNAFIKKAHEWMKDVAKFAGQSGPNFVRGLNTWQGLDKHPTLLSLLTELQKRG